MSAKLAVKFWWQRRAGARELRKNMPAMQSAFAQARAIRERAATEDGEPLRLWLFTWLDETGDALGNALITAPGRNTAFIRAAQVGPVAQAQICPEPIDLCDAEAAGLTVIDRFIPTARPPAIA